MPPKKRGQNGKPAPKARAAKPPAKPTVKAAKDAADDAHSADSIDLNDTASFQVSAAHPELVNELDEKLLPYLKDDITNFLRYKVFKRKRDLDNDGQSNAKRQKKKRVEYDDEWQAQNYLGSGSFGNVGLWVKKNPKGEIEDEIAIKEAKYQEDYAWSNISGLSREAVMQNHVNKTRLQNFVQLRSFKCFIGGPRNHNGTVPEDSTTWLYYLDFAPHGDLLRLIDRYRAWNQYLPEVFLWHAFDSLAKAILAMADLETNMKALPPQAGEDVQTYKSGARLIHFDIKPENIFCGPVAGSDDDTDGRGGLKTSSYPTIKLADFGVTEFDNGRSENNPYRFLPVGTRWYMPPEQKLYGIQWQNPPNHESGIEFAQMESGDFKDNDDILLEICEREADFHFTQAMNVWNVGKTMYDLTSLSGKWDYARLSARYENDYVANNSNAIANFNILPFQASNVANPKTTKKGKGASPPPRQPYSTQLTDLIRDCMKPEVTNRITAQALYTRTQAGLASHDNGKPNGLPKVFFEKNDINNMPPGNEDFPIYHGGKEDGCEEDSDVKALLGAKVDPDWEDLVLPQKKWKSHVTKYERQKAKERQGEEKDNPKSQQSNFQVVDGKILFGAKKARSKKVTASTTKADPAAPSKKQGGPAKPTAQDAKNPSRVAKAAATTTKPAANVKPPPKKQASKKTAAAQTRSDDDDDDGEQDKEGSNSDDKNKGKRRARKPAPKVASKSKANNGKAAANKKQAQK